MNMAADERIDFAALEQWITPDSRVLDLGCGNGTLLRQLVDNKSVHGYGLEIDSELITECIGQGVNVIEQNLDDGLGNFSDDSFDTVIMTQALQVLRRPDEILNEMLRVGKECIVTFPNFGNWQTRLYLSVIGRMPVTKQLDHQWYDTPNIHFCTVNDFEALCQQQHIRILDRQIIAQNLISKRLKGLHPNLFGEVAVYHLSA